MISISRPACGTFQENKYTEKLALNPKFIEYKGVNNPDYYLLSYFLAKYL